jgi:hypothetical protein
MNEDRPFTCQWRERVMAKIKTKKGPLEVVAQETEPRSNLWQWQTSKYMWRWHLGRRLSLERADNPSDDPQFVPVLYVSTFEGAVMYAAGFDASPTTARTERRQGRR